ncbi:sigma-54 interaction domain-containing protein [Caldalkalibacillus salinus]|uniref:sigma-54 interaction domain-containing protein n=1 Tax=Caldalkalibacillus salinus TaxID=2803787 RepID=UPI001F016132|nr:sigma 54-interacting transcriptional regulator [Caldalkalibacillus salinus]
MGQWINSPEMLRAILSSIDEGIHVINAEGKTIYYNHVVAQLDGLTEEEVIGKHVLDIFPSLNEHTSTLLQVIKTGESIVNEPQSYTNLKGKRVETINTTLPIHVDGKRVGALEVAKDISKIKGLSERVLDLQAQIFQRTKQSNAALQKGGCTFHIEHFITQDPVMLDMKKNVLKMAESSAPVLVYGETGTGKEIIAQSLHQASPRKENPFIAQNCAALPSTLLESLLFGTKKGSFTGAMDRKGLFELANEGTLFLDELNAMPMELQAKLLRVLQEGYVRPVGGNKPVAVNVRIVVAMNEDPWEAVKEGRLRADLFYRIHVMSLYLTPLRERKADIPLLTSYFIESFCQRQKEKVRLSPKAQTCFQQYDWPGNVRELEHALEAAIHMADESYLETHHFPDSLQRQWGGMDQDKISAPRPPRMVTIVTDEPQREEDAFNIPSLQEHLEAEEKYWIQKALEETNGNIKRAAHLLSVPRQTLQYKIKKYGLI